EPVSKLLEGDAGWWADWRRYREVARPARPQAGGRRAVDGRMLDDDISLREEHVEAQVPDLHRGVEARGSWHARIIDPLQLDPYRMARNDGVHLVTRPDPDARSARNRAVRPEARTLSEREQRDG